MTGPAAQAETVRLGDTDYPVSRLSAEGRQALDSYTRINAHIQHLKNMQAVLTKARDAYIATLKDEIVSTRTGLDFSDMFSDD